MMTTTREELRVWVGCLACYNDGSLVGTWVDAIEADAPENRPHATRSEPNPDASLVLDQAHEETWCFDHEGFGGFLSGECSPMEAQRIAEAVEAIDGVPLEALAAYAGDVGIESALENAEEAYQGQWDSREDFAQNLAEDIGALNEDASWPNSYIDWERAARDLFMDYTWTDGGHVFRVM